MREPMILAETDIDGAIFRVVLEGGYGVPSVALAVNSGALETLVRFHETDLENVLEAIKEGFAKGVREIQDARSAKP